MSDESASTVSRETIEEMSDAKRSALMAVGWVTFIAEAMAPILFNGDPDLIERTRRECNEIMEYVKAGF